MRLNVGPVCAGAGLLAGLCPGAAWAQFPNLVELGAQYLPAAPLEDPRPVEAQVASYEASLNVPLVLGKNTFLIPGLGYHSDAISYTDAPTGFTELRAFHSLELPLLFVQLLPGDWALSVRLAPGLAADQLGFDEGLLRVSALGLISHTFSERFVLGGGALTTYAFGSFLPLPALYLDWEPLDALRIETFLPAFVAVSYTFWERLELGVRADVAGNAYAVRDDRIQGAWPCAAAAADDPLTAEDEARADPARCFDHVAYSVGSAGVVASVRVIGSVWFTVMAGHSFFRRLELLNAEDVRLAGGLQAIPDVPLFRAGLSWRLPVD